MDVDALLEILHGTRKTENTNTREKIYRDEPILRTAADMKKSMPSRYQEMRRLSIQEDNRYKTQQEIFYRQGMFMAEYEDFFAEEIPFFRYFPTYQSMSDSQLRAYFSWRTKVRHGVVEPTSLSYVFVYIYELLNCIGVKTADEAFSLLREIREKYAPIDDRIERYLPNWMRDFVVYYNLDKSLLQDSDALETDSALCVLLHADEADDDTLYEAIHVLSSYKPQNSRLSKQYPEKMQSVVLRVYRELDAFTRQRQSCSLCEQMFGRLYTTPYIMFGSAPFFDRIPHDNYQYKITDLCTIVHNQDGWHCTKLWGKKSGGADLGLVMKVVDCELRKKLSYPHLIKDVTTSKFRKDIINKAIDDALEEDKKPKIRKVEIDLTKLQGIRDASEVTKEKLIVDEADLEISDEPQTVAEPEPEPVLQNPFDLSEAEMTVLVSLLKDENPQNYLREKGLLLSVVTDSINEKCFDAFADTVLLFDGDIPQVIEDYTSELKGMLGL